MENNSNEITEQQKEDSRIMLETYGNKKAVDNAAKKVSILDFVSKNPARYYINGIFYENGFAIATDGHTLLKQKTDYPPEYEGKIIEPSTGKVIDAAFPNYKKVFPDKEDLIDRSNRLAHITKYLSNATAAVGISPKIDKVPVLFENCIVNSEYLQKALIYARDKGFTKLSQAPNRHIKENDDSPSAYLNRALQFDNPDGSSLLVMPFTEEILKDRAYIDNDGILHNYENETFIKAKLLGKGDDFYKNVLKKLLESSDYESSNIENLFATNLEIAQNKMNPAVFPRDKKECLIYATALTYADAIGENLDKNNLIYENGQNKATFEQFLFNLHLSRFTEIAKKPETLFYLKDNIKPETIIEYAKSDKIIKDKSAENQTALSTDFENEEIDYKANLQTIEAQKAIKELEDFLEDGDIGKNKSEEDLDVETINDDNEYAENLADWIIQEGLSVTKDFKIINITYEEIIEKTNTPEDWLKNNFTLVSKFIEKHNGNELQNCKNNSDINSFELSFATNSVNDNVPNTLFKQTDDGRWIKKSDKELEEDFIEKTEIEFGSNPFTNFTNIVYEKNGWTNKRGFDADVNISAELASLCGINEPFTLQCKCVGPSFQIKMLKPELFNISTFNEPFFKYLQKTLYEKGKNVDLIPILKEINEPNNNLEEQIMNNDINQTYNFFVSDTAYLDLGIGAEVEPLTGLSAVDAVKKYRELNEKGFSTYIGLNIPGDFVFDDKEGIGAGILEHYDDKNTFNINDNFVKELNIKDDENITHAKNVITAYKDLYEAAKKILTDVVEPTFLFEKEKELGFADKSEELTFAIIKHSKDNPEQILTLCNTINNAWFTELYEETEFYTQSEANEILKDLKKNNSSESYEIVDKTFIENLKKQILQEQAQVDSDVEKKPIPYDVFRKKYGEVYEALYDGTNEAYLKKQSESCELFDHLMKNNLYFYRLINEYVKERKDAFTSDRECAAVVITLNELGMDLSVPRYRYYQSQRPVDIATQPKDFIYFENYDKRSFNEDAGCEVWGFVDYERELTDKELKDFELSKPNPFLIKYIKPTPENHLTESYILYGRVGDMKGTPESNFENRISNSHLIQNFNSFESFDQAIEFVNNGFKSLKNKNINTDLDKQTDNASNEVKETVVENLKNIELSVEEWQVCDKLADYGKMDWWYEEYGADGNIPGPVSLEDLNDLSTSLNADSTIKLDVKQIDVLHNLFEKYQIKVDESVFNTIKNNSEKRNEIIPPFSIIDNKEKGRVNIKFDSGNKNPDFDNIIKELKSNGWKFAPSTKQWYPVGKAVENSASIASKLLEKFTADKTITENKEEKEQTTAVYDGIKFFDRNYKEPEELRDFLNKTLKSDISEKETSIILEALDHDDSISLTQRSERLGINEDNKLVIVSRKNSNTEQKVFDYGSDSRNINALFNYAQVKASNDLEELNKMYKNLIENKDEKVISLMEPIYASAIKRKEYVSKKMYLINESYFSDIAFDYDSIKAGLSKSEISEINEQTSWKEDKHFIPLELIQNWIDAENLEDSHQKNLVRYKVYSFFENYNLHEENKLLLSHNYSKLEQMYGELNINPVKVIEHTQSVPKSEDYIHLDSDNKEHIKMLENYVSEHDKAVLLEGSFEYEENKFVKPAELLIEACNKLDYEVCLDKDGKNLFIFDGQDAEKPYAEYDMPSLFELAENPDTLSDSQIQILKRSEQAYNKSFAMAKDKIPYVEVPFSENSNFVKDCNDVISLSDFNNLLIEKEKIMEQNREYFSKGLTRTEKDEGKAYHNFFKAEEEGNITPEQKYGFGSYKTDACLHLFDSIYDDVLTYNLTLDFGSINCSIFDYIKETCSYPEVIDAISKTENKLYFSSISDNDRKTILEIKNKIEPEFNKAFVSQIEVLKELRESQKGIRSAWLIEASVMDKANKNLEETQKQFVEICKNFIISFNDSLNIYSMETQDKDLLKKYISKEIKNMIIDQTHGDSRKGYTKNIEEKFDYALWHDELKFIPCNTEELDNFISETIKASEHEITKESQKVVYTRTSYRGWEFSIDKEFKESVYCRPCNDPAHPGYWNAIGKENEDGFWMEKFNNNLVNCSKTEALVNTLNLLLSDKKVQQYLNITDKTVLEDIPVINAESGKDVRPELYPHLYEKVETKTVTKKTNTHTNLSVGMKIGEDTVIDSGDDIKLSAGVYEAVLSRVNDNGSMSAASYLILDKLTASKCNPDIIDFAKEVDGFFVFYDKTKEAYIRKELIDKNLCPLPSGKEDYYSRLEEYIEEHPLKYAKLLSNTAFNFEKNLKLMQEIESDQKDILSVGKKLISMASTDEQKLIGEKILKNGGKDEPSMRKLFENWLNPSKEKIIKKDGYPPRGEE